MMDFISQITDKPGWDVKVFDDEIVSKWRAETQREVTASGHPDKYMSRKMFDYVR